MAGKVFYTGMSENREDIAPRSSRLYILLGIAFAVLAMFFVTVVALESVLFSPSYYLKLEDNFDMSGQMNLTPDGYIRYYNCYMTYISEGEESALEARAGISDNRPLFSQADKESLAYFRGVYAFLGVAKWVALVLCAGILIIVFVRATKAEVRLIGGTSCVAVPLLAAILYAVYLFIARSLPPIIPDIAQNGLLYIFMNTQVMDKFYQSWITMCLVFAVAPFAVSLFFARVGKRKHEDLTDDYMYQ